MSVVAFYSNGNTDAQLQEGDSQTKSVTGIDYEAGDLIVLAVNLESGDSGPNVSPSGNLANGESWTILPNTPDSATNVNQWIFYAHATSTETNQTISTLSDWPVGGPWAWSMGVWVMRGNTTISSWDYVDTNTTVTMATEAGDDVLWMLGDFTPTGVGSTTLLTASGLASKRWERNVLFEPHGYIYAEWKGVDAGSDNYGLLNYTGLDSSSIAIAVTKTTPPVEHVADSVYTTAGTATTSHVVDLPTYSVGDVVVISMAWNGSPGNLSFGSGFNQLFTDQSDGWGDNTNPKSTILWKRMDGTEGTTLTITSSNSINAGGGGTSFRNVDPDNPFPSPPRWASAVTGGSTHDTPINFSVVNGSAVLIGAANNSSSQTYTPPTGFTESYDANQATTGGKACTAAWRIDQFSHGKLPSFSFTPSSDFDNNTWSLVLNPVGAPPFTVAYADRVVENGATPASGDFTSETFTTRADTLLVATVAVDVQYASGLDGDTDIPTPTTTGTTWTLVGRAGPEGATATNGDYTAHALVYMADSPGAHTDRTFAMSGAATAWDNGIAAIDVTVLEFSDALPLASQFKNHGLRFDNFRTAGGRDPGGQEVIYGRHDQEGSAGVGLAYLNTGKSHTPLRSSYTVALAAIDADAQTPDAATGFGVAAPVGAYHVYDRVSGFTRSLTSATAVRPPGYSRTWVEWQDLCDATTGQIYDFSLICVEVQRRPPIINYTADDTTNSTTLASATPILWDQFVNSGTGDAYNEPTLTSDQIPNPTTFGDVVDRDATGRSILVYRGADQQQAVNQRVTVSGVLVDQPSASQPNNVIGCMLRLADANADSGTRGYMAWLQNSEAGNTRLQMYRITAAATTELAATGNLEITHPPEELHDVSLEVRGTLLVAYLDGEETLWYDISADATQYTDGGYSGVWFTRGDASTSSQPFFKGFSAERIADFQEIPWELSWVARNEEVLDAGAVPCDDGDVVSNWLQTSYDLGSPSDATGDFDSVSGSPTFAQDHFAPGVHGIDCSGGIIGFSAGLTTAINTGSATNGITLGTVVECYDEEQAGVILQLGTLTTDTHSIRPYRPAVQDPHVVSVYVGTVSYPTDVPWVAGRKYAILAHINTASSANSWVMVNGRTATFTSGAPTTIGTTTSTVLAGAYITNDSQVIMNAAGYMEGQPTSAEISSFWKYAQEAGVELEKWAHVGVDETYYADTTNVNTVDVVPFATPGNLLVGGIVVDKDAGSFTTPTGWTLIDNGADVSDVSVAMYYRKATGTVDDIFSPSWSNLQSNGDAHVAEYFIPDGKQASFQTSNKIVSADSLSNNQALSLGTHPAETLGVWFAGIDSDPGSVSFTNITERENSVGLHQAGAGQAVGAFADKVYAASATRNTTVTWGGADGMVTIAVAFTLIDDVGTTVPAAVSDLAGTAGVEQVVLTWSAPSDGGSAITDYEVWYGVRD